VNREPLRVRRPAPEGTGPVSDPGAVSRPAQVSGAGRQPGSPDPVEPPSEGETPHEGGLTGDAAVDGSADVAADAPSDTSVDAPADAATDSAADAPADAQIDVVDLIESLEEVTRERDEYLAMLQRLQAEFDNFRKRTAAHSEDRVAAGIARLVEALLPVLDACDAAVAAGETSVEPIGRQLEVILGKEGLHRIPTEGEQFDPAVHEAVLSEAGDGDTSQVVEEFRSGYTWGGRVLRPAAVKVRL